MGTANADADRDTDADAEKVTGKIKEMGEELKVAMFLTGCKSTTELKEAEVIITGKANEIAEQRGFIERLKRKKRQPGSQMRLK
jgi:hypothetical protein